MVWCGRQLDDYFPVEIDLVTLATPYEHCTMIEAFAELGMLIGGKPFPFETSCGALDFGGDQARPSCVCSYTAIVTGDEDGAAGNDPPGSEVANWNPVVKNIAGVDHLGSLAATLNSPELLPLLNPGCRCGAG